MTTYTEALKEEITRCKKELCELKNKHSWHDAEEIRPDKSMVVLVICCDDIPRVATYINGKFTDWQKTYHPEYWMELPDLPSCGEPDDE